MMKTPDTPTIRSSALLSLLGIAIWWMCANVVWLGDDLDYKYMMKGEIWQSWGYINSVQDFFSSQWIHYQSVNGRYVAHALVQLFNSQLGQQAFAICNAVVYVLFALLLAKAGKASPSGNPGGLLSAICLSVLCFITKMMPTCQIGYIWGMAANLAWMMGFFHSQRPSWLSAMAMMLAGVAVGNWQESVSIGVCAGLGIWWIIMLSDTIRLKSPFDWRHSWMLLGYVVGTASNCFAPSTMGRVSDMTMPLTDQLLIASYSMPAIVLLAICILVIGRRHGSIGILSFKRCETSIPNGVLTVGMLMLVCFNVAIGIYSNRQLFGANLFAAILVLSILPRHRFSRAVNALASITVIAFWALMAHGTLEVRRQYREIETRHLESNDGCVYFDRTRVMPFGFPVRAKYYEDILGQFDNDLHHSLMKDFKHERKGRTLKLIPTASSDGERVECYAPGHFTVTVKEPRKGEAPREVMVYGHYFFPALKASPRRLQVTRYSKRRPPYATAVIIPEFPFFTTDSISIIDQSFGCGTNQPMATP